MTLHQIDPIWLEKDKRLPTKLTILFEIYLQYNTIVLKQNNMILFLKKEGIIEQLEKQKKKEHYHRVKTLYG